MAQKINNNFWGPAVCTPTKEKQTEEEKEPELEMDELNDNE